RLLASRADTRDLVERRHADRLLAARAMRADGEAMRLIAQTLQEIEHRVARLEAHRLLSRAEEALAPGVAVRPLGDADDGNLADTEIGQHGVGRRHLPGAAVDQQQVGPRAGQVTSANAVTCPAPPSISNRSGHAPPSRPGSSLSAREKR